MRPTNEIHADRTLSFFTFFLPVPPTLVSVHVSSMVE